MKSVNSIGKYSETIRMPYFTLKPLVLHYVNCCWVYARCALNLYSVCLKEKMATFRPTVRIL